MPGDRRLDAQTARVSLHRPRRRQDDQACRRHRIVQRPLDRMGARRADGTVRPARLRTPRAHPLGAEYAASAPWGTRRPTANVPHHGWRAMGRPSAHANSHRGQPRASRRARTRRGRRIRKAPQEGPILQVSAAPARRRDDRPQRPGPLHHHPCVYRRHGRHRQARQPARKADRGGSGLPAPRAGVTRAQPASWDAGRAAHRQHERHDGPSARLGAARPASRPAALPDARPREQAAAASLLP